MTCSVPRLASAERAVVRVTELTGAGSRSSRRDPRGLAPRDVRCLELVQPWDQYRCRWRRAWPGSAASPSVAPTTTDRRAAPEQRRGARPGAARDRGAGPGGFVPRIAPGWIRRAPTRALSARVDLRPRRAGGRRRGRRHCPASVARTPVGPSSPTPSPTCSGATEPAGPMVTGGQGSRRPHCGDRFLFALRPWRRFGRTLGSYACPRTNQNLQLRRRGSTPPTRDARESRRRQPVAAERAAALAPVSPRRRRPRRRVHAASAPAVLSVPCPR